MDNNIESEAPPPVSSLRSRWEAMSKKADAPEEPNGGNRSTFGSKISKSHKSEDRPSTPKVVVSPASSSNAPNVPLKRVVSAPTHEPTSPAANETSFAALKSTRISHSNSSGQLASNRAHEDEDEDDNPTPSPATPRKTPSTPSFTIGLADKGGGIGIGNAPGSAGGDRRSFSGPSTTSSDGSAPARRRGLAQLMDRVATDADELSRKLSRKPPPPPPGKKPPPPTPSSRNPGGASSQSSSRSITPSADSEETRPIQASNPHIHLRSESLGSNLSVTLSPPPLPARATPSPTLPPRSPVPQSPALPPRSTEGAAADNTLLYHQNRGFRTPSAEHLSPTGSDGSEHGKPSLVPPKLPSRSSANSVPSSPASASGPPLPRRSYPLATTTDQPTSAAPRLPPRGAGTSAPGSLGDAGTHLGAGRRVPPPPESLFPSPSSNGSRESLTPTGESSAILPPPQRTPSSESFLPPPSRVIPPNQDGYSNSHHHHHHHHYPHIPHQLNSLPITKILAAVKLGGSHGSNSGSRSPQGHTGPNLEASPGGNGELTGTAGLPPPPTRNLVERMTAIRPHSSMGGHDQDDGTSSDEDDGHYSAPGSGKVGGTGGIKRPAAKVGEELPDSSRSNRRPPILPEFQHPPPVYAAHHRPLRTGGEVTGSQLHVPAHSGVVAVAGWWTVIASSGVITITHMNVAERERGKGGGVEEVVSDMDEEMGYGGMRAGGAKGVWSIEMKEMKVEWKVDKPRVTAMEFRHSSQTPERSSRNLSRTSANNSRSSIKQTETIESDPSDEGRYVWCGTRDGCLFELDVWNGGRMTDLRVGAHTGHVTGIYRLPGHRMMTLDEHGKCLVFCGVGLRRNEEDNNLSSKPEDALGGYLSRANPRIHRIMHKEGFARVLNGRLWTSPAPGSSSTSTGSNPNATGSGESLASSMLGSGGSLASIAQAATKPPRHHHHQRNGSRTGTGPLIRIHEVDDDGALITKHPMVGPGIGAVLCGTVLLSTPGLVYLGHEGGWVSVWGPGVPDTKRQDELLRPPVHRHNSASSLTSASTNSSYSDDEALTDDETLAGEHASAAPRNGPGSPRTPDSTTPVCLRRVKISVSDVISLEGVGSRLWAGTRKGLIYAYDVAGGAKGDVGAIEDTEMEKGLLEGTKQKPWVVTNVWKAHGELPVLRIVVDPYSVAKTHKLVVYSVGRDEALHFWDGFLSQNWIDSQLLTRESSFCTFRPIKMLVCTWNIDAAKPEALVGTNNVTFIQRFLASPALEGAEPDIIVFGFQEVIDLENKKLTAKTVLLGSGKKRADGTISAKVSRHYRLWHDRLVAEVQKAYPSGSYIVQHTENLVGLFTCVFVRRALAHPTPTTKAIRDISITTIKCGMHGLYGNKGAIVARFTVDDSSFCFLNCHLAAGQSQRVARNMDLAAILEEKSVFPVSSEDPSSASDFVAYVGGGDGSMVLDHELCFLNGDLNYRIEQRRDAVISNVQAGKINHLLQYDQLLHEMKTNPAFRLQTFTEPPITFAPTYKYDRQSNNYDSSEKRRIPAWCDRILYRSRDASRIETLWYGRYEPDVSDHRPVCGAYRVVVKKVIPEKRARELGAVRKLWEKEQLRLGAETRAFYEGQR